ncbi:MAG: cupin domain-containing protein [Planctomycetota bacterium]
MSEIKIEKLGEPELKARGVLNWPIWEKGESEFPWHYDDREQCLILRGEVTVQPESGAAVRFAEGDFVTFPKGMSCTWTVHRAVRKHYQFG